VPSPDLAAAAGQYGARKRWHPDDAGRLAEARRDLRAVQLEHHVRQVVDDDPPPTADQRVRLAGLLLRSGAA
jgi:hypothetical protein